MPSKHISPSANTSNPLCNSPHAFTTHFNPCQHLKPSFQLPPCPQNTFQPVPTPQTPFLTPPMPSQHISTRANTSNPLFNCPHALKTRLTQCQHLKPPFQLPPCPQNIFHPVPKPQTPFSTPPMPSKLHPVPTPQTPFSTTPMPSKHISPSANTSKPLFSYFHALQTHFTQCQHLKHPFQLPPCPQNTSHPVPTPQTPFSTAPMPSKHNSPSANTSNPLFNSPHALKTHFTRCLHLKPPFQRPPCPQNTFHPVPTPQTAFSTAPMPSKHNSPGAYTSNPLFNCPHDLRTQFTRCQHFKPPFQLPPCPQNTIHPVPTPRTPFSTAPMPSKHILPSANTSNSLFNYPHALKTHFTRCLHLKPPFQLPPCPEITFHAVPTPQTPFSTPPMPSQHISTRANTSNPLFNCPHALKTHFTPCQHLKPPSQLPPCPQTIFHPVPKPQTLFSTTPMPSKQISTRANTSNTLFNCPHALKTRLTQCQHLKPRFQLPPCPQNTIHPMPTPQTPFSAPPMPSQHISPSANTSNTLFNCPHALRTQFTQCKHFKPPFQHPPCPENTFHPVPTPETPLQLPPWPQNTFHPVPKPRTPFSTPPMPSKHSSPIANTSNPLFNSPHALKTQFTSANTSNPPFQLPPCPQNTIHPVPTPETPFSIAPMPSKHISPGANTSNPLCNSPHALKTHFTQCQHLKPPFQRPHAVKAHFTQCLHLQPPFQLPPCPQNTFHQVPTPQTPFSTPPMP